jgi:hypothetical protein
MVGQRMMDGWMNWIGLDWIGMDGWMDLFFHPLLDDNSSTNTKLRANLQHHQPS